MSLLRYTGWDLAGTSVLYRIDANISFDRPEHRRLSGMRETLSALVAAGARVTILAHRGRPMGFDSELTMAPLEEYCKWYGFFSPSVIVSENVRFDAREYDNDESYAAELSQGHDYYVTDAWASLHNNHTSIVACALQFPRERRSIGTLVAHEIAMLWPLREQHYQRWSILLGGGKVSEKIRPIMRAYERGITPSVYMGPGGTAELAEQLRRAAHLSEQAVVFCEGELSQHEEVRGISSATADMIFDQLAERAGAVFVTGPMGVGSNRKPYEELLHRLEGASCDLFIGGGGTSELYDQLFPNGRAVVSSGGGAALAYICGDSLPGLTVIAGTSASL